jgi:hypothetical protein
VDTVAKAETGKDEKSDLFYDDERHGPLYSRRPGDEVEAAVSKLANVREGLGRHEIQGQPNAGILFERQYGSYSLPNH